MMLWQIGLWILFFIFIAFNIFFIYRCKTIEDYWTSYKYEEQACWSIVLILIGWTVIITLFCILFKDWLAWCWTDFWTTDVSAEQIKYTILMIIGITPIIMTIKIRNVDRPTCEKCDVKCRRKDTHCHKCGGKL